MGDRLTARAPGLGGWSHLAGRFFEFMRVRGLSPREQSEVAALLRRDERGLFWRQGAADQRHALTSARAALEAAPGRRDLARAALLHDLGKQVSGLGLLGRSLASVLAKLRLPVGGRFRLYLDHGAIGGDLLEGLRAERLVVVFARHHHDSPPPEVDPPDWELLQRCDRKPSPGRGIPIR